MPRFLYSVIFVTLLLWGTIIYMIFNIPPASIILICLFLVLMFFGFSTLVSFPIYFTFVKKTKHNPEYRTLYRKSFRWGLLIGFGLACLLFLKVFNLINLVTIALFLLFYSVLLYQMRYNR